MTDNVIYGVDFKQPTESAQLHALSHAMAPDAVFVDEQQNINYRRSRYFSPPDKDSA